MTGSLSLEIFNDQFRAGSPRSVAVDGQRSLIYLLRTSCAGHAGAAGDAAAAAGRDASASSSSSSPSTRPAAASSPGCSPGWASARPARIAARL